MDEHSIYLNTTVAYAVEKNMKFKHTTIYLNLSTKNPNRIVIINIRNLQNFNKNPGQ